MRRSQFAWLRKPQATRLICLMTRLWPSVRAFVTPSSGNPSISGHQHSILIVSWHMLTNGELYTDPGPDYFVKRRPTQTQARAIHQLESLGYTVTLEPLKMAG